MNVRAFLVTVAGWNGNLDFAGIYAATSAAKARARAVYLAHDAGYDALTFADFSVRRIPALDEWATAQPENDRGGYSPRYIDGAPEAIEALLSASEVAR